MILRLVIWILRRLLWSLLSVVVFTLFGGGRMARRALRVMGLMRRLGRLRRL